MAISLYHFGPSPFSARVRLTLEEKAIAWESRIVNLARLEHLAPWYVQINPKGLIPALVDGDRIISESLVIMRYLEERYPERPLLALDGPERADAETWISRGDEFPLGPLHVALASPFMLAMEKRAIPKIMRRLQTLAEKHEGTNLGHVYAAKLEASRRQFSTYDVPMARADAIDRIEKDLGEMEKALTGRAWLAGAGYSLADVVWTVNLARLCFLGQKAQLHDASRPNVKRYVDALWSRPSFKTADVWDRITPGRIWRTALGGLFSRPKFVENQP